MRRSFQFCLHVLISVFFCNFIGPDLDQNNRLVPFTFFITATILDTQVFTVSFVEIEGELLLERLLYDFQLFGCAGIGLNICLYFLSDFLSYLDSTDI
mmetsp:Transcript_15768/g.21342  ORF Transcript_15768/g.21342 Transcript_15768/m.21342 type:complete len:98 (+) Transcript_15768:2117-2410(+)